MYKVTSVVIHFIIFIKILNVVSYPQNVLDSVTSNSNQDVTDGYINLELFSTTEQLQTTITEGFEDVDKKSTVSSVLSTDQEFQNDEEVGRKNEGLIKLKELFGIEGNVSNNRSKRKTPQFMKELYSTVAKADGTPIGNNPYDAKIVRSYVEQSISKSGYFLFNITGLNENEVILEAELHLFRLPNVIHESVASTFTSPYYLLRVYQVTDVNQLDNPDLHILLNVQYVNAYIPGWQVFNVKQAVLSWLSRETENLGLLVTASAVNGDPVQLTFIRRDERDSTKQPILVLFNNEQFDYDYKTEYMNALMQLRPRRSLPISDSNTKISNNLTETNDPPKCTRLNLFVNFHELGWSDFIVAPLGYDAYHCRGECAFPLEPTQKLTNHAIVQSLVYKLKLDQRVDKPCCVPTTLSPINVLYFDENDNIILKRYEEMVVTYCGCQ